MLVCLWCGRMGARTVMWLPKRLGCIGYQIFLPMVLRCERERKAPPQRQGSIFPFITKFIRCIALLVSVPSIIWVGAGLMQITMQRTRPAWPAKKKLRTQDCLRIAKEIAMMNGIFVESRSRHALFLQETRTRKIRKIFEENYSIISRNRAITSNEPWNTETKRVDRNARFTVKCFLRGPLI